jgi:2'-5' RNA ligase
VKTSALAIVPDESALPLVQALRAAHDRQVRVWPPHINLLYPFVPEKDFDIAATSLAETLKDFACLRLRFCRKGHFGSTAFLVPECDTDPGLTLLHKACVAAFPNLPKPEHDFMPHLTIGQFANQAECKAFLNSCPPMELEISVGSLCMLARDSMQHPFRMPHRVMVGVDSESAVIIGSPQPYAFRALRSLPLDGGQEHHLRNFFQFDSSLGRLVFTVDAEDIMIGDGQRVKNSARARRTLFVVDQSSSMRNSYQQVKDAVKYMTEEAHTERHQLDFVLYNAKARRASASDVLSSEACSTTNFQEAFREIREYINTHPPGTAMSIVFMTDGQDTSSCDLSSAKSSLREYLKACERDTAFHAIGFTSSHDNKFLQEICSMGTTEGMYRYAEGKNCGLQERFSEMFDFADVHVKTQLLIGETEIECSGEEIGDAQVRFDMIIDRSKIDASFSKGESCQIFVGGAEVLLQYEKTDPMFAIRSVDEMQILTQQDLDNAQALLSATQPHKALKAVRKGVADAKTDAQARLDKYHQLFAQGARSNLTSAGGSLAAQLNSLRHEATFSKARRARAMAQRATVNASAVELMERVLQAMPPVDSSELQAIEAQQLCCTLSGDTAADVMRDSQRDFFVFGLRVCRPEDVIDAPTALDLQQVLSGVYSNEAFQSGAQHALRTGGAELAHGGFSGSIKNPIALGDGVGLFRGPDGSLMNACLPLYLSEAHFARVRVQIKPILGYFFTLDPLGYKGDQIIALFGILGKMLCSRASASDGETELLIPGSWLDWLIDDFTKLCNGLRPIAM